MKITRTEKDNIIEDEDNIIKNVKNDFRIPKEIDELQLKVQEIFLD